MYRLIDKIKTVRATYGTLVYESDSQGLVSQSLDLLLNKRTLYRGGQQARLDAMDAYLAGDVFFHLRLHDDGHVDGRGVEYTLNFQEAVTKAEQLSATGSDVVIHACVRGWGFPECDLGRWSAGLLVSQSYHVREPF